MRFKDTIALLLSGWIVLGTPCPPLAAQQPPAPPAVVSQSPEHHSNWSLPLRCIQTSSGRRSQRWFLMPASGALPVAEFRAAYDATVAHTGRPCSPRSSRWRALADERILQDESMPVDQSVKSAQRALDLSTARATLLSAQRTQVDLLTNPLTASVQLVVSLGGGWDVSRLPSTHDVKTASIR